VNEPIYSPKLSHLLGKEREPSPVIPTPYARAHGPRTELWGTMLLYGCPNPTCNGALSRLECSGTQVADSTGSSPLSWLVPRLEAGDYLAHVETSGEVPIDGVPYTLTYRVLDDCSL
jgi:hypothetical protein